MCLAQIDMEYAHIYIHSAQYRHLQIFSGNYLNIIRNMIYNFPMITSESIPIQNQDILSGVGTFPFSQNVLINTNKLAQAEKRIGKIAEPMFHTVGGRSTDTKVCVTGVILERLKLFGAYYSTPVLIRSVPLQAYHVLVPLSGNITAELGSGETLVAPGAAIICPVGSRLQLNWAAECLVLVAIIPPAEFEKTLRRHSPVVQSPPAGIRKINLNKGSGKSFTNLLNCLCIECNNRYEGDAPETIAAGLQELLLVSLAQIHTNASGPDYKLQGTHRRRQAVVRAIDFIQHNAHRAVSLSELSGIAYLSARSLQMGFTESFGIGPMTYSKYLRLAKAHEALSAASSISVTAVALQYGFGNLGTFSRLYKQRYGEFPSTTLRRANGRIVEKNNPATQAVPDDLEWVSENNDISKNIM